MKKGLLVLPAYNEAENIPFSMKKIESAIYENKDKIDLSMLVIDDESTDTTPKLLDGYRSVFGNKMDVIRHKANKGVVCSVKEGFKTGIERGFDYVIKTDLDRDFDQREVITTLSDSLLNNAPVVFVARWREISKEENSLEYELRKALVESINEKFKIEGLDPPSLGSQGFEVNALRKLMSNPYVSNYEKRWGMDMVLPIIARKMGIPTLILKSKGNYDPKRRPRDKVLSQYSTYWSNIEELSNLKSL